MTPDRHKVATAVIAGSTITACIATYGIAVGVASNAHPAEQSFWPYPWLAVPALLALVAGLVWFMIAFDLTDPPEPRPKAPKRKRTSDVPWVEPYTPPVFVKEVEPGRRWHVTLINNEIVATITYEFPQYRVTARDGTLYGQFATLEQAAKIARRQLNP